MTLDPQAQALMARGELTTVGGAAAAVGMSRSYFTRIYQGITGRPPGAGLRS